MPPPSPHPLRVTSAWHEATPECGRGQVLVRLSSQDSLLRASRRARRFLPKTSVAPQRFFRPDYWGDTE